MAKYLIRQVLAWLVRIFIAVNLTFFVASAFLDPASNYAERRPPVPPEQIQRMLEPYNLSTNEPLWHRWWDWLTGIVLHWDWGHSPVGEVVNDQVSFRIGMSAQLMMGATIVAFVIGVALGVYSAARQYKLGDRVVQLISIVALNTSIVVVALVVVYLAIQINRATGSRIFFVTGAASIDVAGFWPSLVDKAQHLILPSICLVFISFAQYAMMQRSLLLDNIAADYVRTARAKGLPQAKAIRRHALRTSMIPVMVTFAFSIPAVFTGAMLSENIFAWNGMGQYMVQTILKNDINGAVAVAAFSSLMTAIGAVLSDLCVVWLDPRVRVS
ncbi:MAG: ABC transporter permease [Propionibacteriaceae bacterium]|jgi:peptide/nickel transport system permease protein|nr:ABC transporter permease [Propionibacteriaceae bacterium]